MCTDKIITVPFNVKNAKFERSHSAD